MSESEYALGDAAEARARYQSWIDEIDVQRKSLEAIDSRYGILRIALFFVSIMTWLFAAFADVEFWVGLFGALMFLAFLVVVVINEPIRDRLDEIRRQKSVIRRLLARLDRDWDALATKRYTELLAEVPLSESQKDVSDDLDLLGRVSLFHLVSMAATTPGIRTLATWLTESADGSVASERAKAAQQLAPLHDQRLRFYTLAREIGNSSGDPDQFVAWSCGEPWLKSRMWLVAWANISLATTVTLLAALALGVFGVIPATGVKFIGLGLFALAAFNFVFTSVVLGPAHAIFSIAMSTRQSVANYQELFSSAENLPDSLDNDGLLAKIRDTILKGDRCATAGLGALQSVARAGSMRQDPMLFFVYLPLQGFALWDVRVLRRLEQWQETYADNVPGWFQSLGELEAFISIAALADEYPQWSFPIWKDPDNQAIQSQALGHPLLPDGHRVCNDVSVGPPGTVLLVTGSNMSGKSTMLRSLGLNVSLAAIGAPVCAKKFELPSLHLATSIRVRDNLGEGVSFYMAELKRLKSVVDQAREQASNPEMVLLFLLDEILQGTNSRERQIAVVQVLEHLMDSKAIGAISTHDLELADESRLQSLSQTVHFRETIRPDADGNEQMTFDYQMRQGVSPTTNALRLLEMVGLGQDQK